MGRREAGIFLADQRGMCTLDRIVKTDNDPGTNGILNPYWGWTPF